MSGRRDTLLYILSAAGLLAAAGALFAAALPAPAVVHAAAPAAPAAPAVPVAQAFVQQPAPPVVGTPSNQPGPGPERTRSMPTTRPPGARGGPAAEVDRWARRLAADTATAQRALARFAVYRPLILETLRKYDLPLDLAYLPWVESEWRNEARSKAGAVGMWQFMPATARGYGLEVSAYIDERRDPIRATDAAARHLADLFRATRDWHAALASYNAGLGRARHTSGAFWSRRRTLPAETRAYVPRVLAAGTIGRQPAAFGLHQPVRAPLRFREIMVEGGTPLEAVARRHGADTRAVAELNPHLIRGMTPPARRWPVRLPLSSAERGQ